MRAAGTDAESLPDNPAVMRALLAEALSRCEALEGERATLEAQNERLRHLLLKLKRMQFGRRSERLPQEQLELGLADLETALAKADAEAEKRDPDLRKARGVKRRASRGALPAHLPRIEVVVAPLAGRRSRVEEGRASAQRTFREWSRLGDRP